MKMIKRCKVCGIVRKTVIKCNTCERLVCPQCFHLPQGKCIDCVTDDFSIRYITKDVIEKYNEKVRA